MSINNYATDSFTAKDGSTFDITFIKHASLRISTQGLNLYFDPVSSFCDYSTMEKADFIFITHHHYDHLDVEAIAAVSTPDTIIVCDATSSEMIEGETITARAGFSGEMVGNITVECVAAYNTSADKQDFHPDERGDLGYILTIGGTRIYISGDSEFTPEMASLQDIEIALLSANQPYTMDEDQVIEAVKTLKPTIFYPYHYGQTDHVTDLERIAREVGDTTQMRIRSME